MILRVNNVGLHPVVRTACVRVTFNSLIAPLYKMLLVVGDTSLSRQLGLVNNEPLQKMLAKLTQGNLLLTQVQVAPATAAQVNHLLTFHLVAGASPRSFMIFLESIAGQDNCPNLDEDECLQRIHTLINLILEHRM